MTNPFSKLVLTSKEVCTLLNEGQEHHERITPAEPTLSSVDYVLERSVYRTLPMKTECLLKDLAVALKIGDMYHDAAYVRARSVTPERFDLLVDALSEEHMAFLWRLHSRLQCMNYHISSTPTNSIIRNSGLVSTIRCGLDRDVGELKCVRADTSTRLHRTSDSLEERYQLSHMTLVFSTLTKLLVDMRATIPVLEAIDSAHLAHMLGYVAHEDFVTCDMGKLKEDVHNAYISATLAIQECIASGTMPARGDSALSTGSRLESYRGVRLQTLLGYEYQDSPTMSKYLYLCVQLAENAPLLQQIRSRSAMSDGTDDSFSRNAFLSVADVPSWSPQTLIVEYTASGDTGSLPKTAVGIKVDRCSGAELPGYLVRTYYGSIGVITPAHPRTVKILNKLYGINTAYDPLVPTSFVVQSVLHPGSDAFVDTVSKCLTDYAFMGHVDIKDFVEGTDGLRDTADIKDLNEEFVLLVTPDVAQ